MLLDHIGFVVADFARSRAFYDKTLAPLKVAVVMEVTPQMSGKGWYVGYGKTADSGHVQAGKPSFWFGEGEELGNRLHVAFVADSRADVDAFYAAAMAAGGVDNGPPGVRAMYHPNYYGAFVLDPDGHNVEAVCHAPG